jgi:hypothetical protein
VASAGHTYLLVTLNLHLPYRVRIASGKATATASERPPATVRIDSALARHVGLGPLVAPQYDRDHPEYVVAEVTTSGPHRVSVSAPIVVYDGPSTHYEYRATLTWTFTVR